MKKTILLLLSIFLLLGSEVCASALSDAVKANNVNQVQTILQGNVADADKDMALVMASAAGDTQIVQLLVNAGAYVDTQDDNKTTPLMQAAANDHADIVTILLNAKADMTKTDKNGKTAWNYAVATGKADVVTAFISVVSQSDKDSALLNAVQQGQTDIAQVLITNGANVNATDAYKMTPLMYATSNNNLDLMKALINAKADVNARNKVGLSVLGSATSKDAETLLKANKARPLPPVPTATSIDSFFGTVGSNGSFVNYVGVTVDVCQKTSTNPKPNSKICSQAICDWKCAQIGQGKCKKVLVGACDFPYGDCYDTSIQCLCQP